MNTKNIAKTLAICAISAVAAATAETYRLRYSAQVEVLDESGKVVGRKKLPAKTLLAPAPKEEPAPVHGAFLAPEIYKMEQTPHTEMRAKVYIHSLYGVMDNLTKDYWALDVFAFSKDWDNGTRFYGFVKKDSGVGRYIHEKLKDGSEKYMVLTVSPLPKELYKYEAKDYVLIESARLRDEEKGQK